MASMDELLPFELHEAVAVLLPPATNDLMLKVNRRCREVWMSLLTSPSFMRANLAATSRAGFRKVHTAHIDILLDSSPLDFISTSVWYLREVIHLLPERKDSHAEKHDRYSLFSEWSISNNSYDFGKRQVVLALSVIYTPAPTVKNLKKLARVVASALSMRDPRIINTAELTIRGLLQPSQPQYHHIVASIIRALSPQEHADLCDLCLWQLCRAGQTDLVRHMLESRKGDPSILDSLAFRLAVSSRRLDIARMLLKLDDDRRVCPDAADGQTLCDAAYAGDIDAVVFLIEEAGCDPTMRGCGAFLMALERGHTNIAALFLRTGKIDPAFEDNRPLIHAAKGGNLDCLRMLLDAGSSKVDPAAQDGQALVEAARCGHLSIVESLLGTGAVNVSVQDWLPVFEAAKHSRVDVIRYLVYKGLLTDENVVEMVREATVRARNSIRSKEAVIEALDGLRLNPESAV